MDTFTLAAGALVALVTIGIVVVMLRRSWGSSLDRGRPLAGAPESRAVRYNSVADIPGQSLADIRALLAQGNKIQAIKLLRELTGLGLKEAKDAVEALGAGAPVSIAPIRAQTSYAEIPAQALEEARALVERGNKIEAIKRVRELTGMGLKEAKDYVDALPLPGAASPARIANAGPSAPADLSEVHMLARKGQKIQAIKRYRELTGVGLKEAKDYVDSFLS